MKVLWLVNIAMPDACQALGLPISHIGGWLTGYKEAILSQHPDVELHIVEPFDQSKPFSIQTLNDNLPPVTHHLFPASWAESANSFASTSKHQLSALSNRLPSFFSDLHNEVQPDVVHIHGTEMAHSLTWVEACGSEHTLVSIQGLVSVYSRYYWGGLTQEDLKGCWSFNDWRFNRTIPQEQQNYIKRGKTEQELIKLVSHVAGRTSWDHAQTWAINPEAKYHTLQEVLRAQFYKTDNGWLLQNCQRHRIFVSQSHYPIKGLHKLLQALSIVLRHYPDAELYIVGQDRLKEHWRHRSTYVNVLRKLIRTHNLLNKVHYLGFLTADQMIEQFKMAHVYVCPSAIENSCNSLCEAQILGTPVVASYVGGLMDLIEHGKTGMLYRFEEVEMLAHNICQIFRDNRLATYLSNNEREVAQKRHNRSDIADTLYNIYSWI